MRQARKKSPSCVSRKRGELRVENERWGAPSSRGTCRAAFGRARWDLRRPGATAEWFFSTLGEITVSSATRAPNLALCIVCWLMGVLDLLSPAQGFARTHWRVTVSRFQDCRSRNSLQEFFSEFYRRLVPMPHDHGWLLASRDGYLGFKAIPQDVRVFQL